MISKTAQDKYFTTVPKFKIGDLVTLPKGGAFLEKQWLTCPTFLDKTIRPYDYLFVNKNTICLILNTNSAFYEVLILTNDLLFKSLVIFVGPFDRTAVILNEHTAI